MLRLKNIPIIILFSIIILSQVRAVEPRAKPDVQVEVERKNPKDTPTQIQSLIEDFAKGHDGGGRVAYKKVVQIGKPAIPYLKESLKDSRKNVRWISVEAIGAIDGQEAVGPLVLALQDSDKDVRRYAAWFLGDCGQGNEAVSVALINVLWDPNLEVVWHAMDALERLGETSYKEDIELVDSLCLHLDNPDHHWREHAAKALGIIGNQKACGPLVKAFFDHRRRETRFGLGGYHGYIERALVKIGSHNAVPLLLALLQDSTLDGRRRVYRSVGEVLRELGDPNINGDLLFLTKSSNKKKQLAAVIALGFSNNTVALPRLTEIVLDNSENSRIREHAAKALGRIGNIEAVDALDKALVDGNVKLRREAAEALGRIRCPQAVDSLIRALNDSNVFVVMYATESLGKLGDKKAVKPIVELFDRGLPDPDVLVASSPRLANLPTVAHHALVAIMKDDVSPQKIETISNQDQLKEIREAWRIKLGLQEKSSSSSSQVSKGIVETQPDMHAEGEEAASYEQTREVFLPDIDEKGLMLDITSGKLLNIPQADSLEAISAAVDITGRGDIFYDDRCLIFVRGSIPEQALTRLLPFKYHVGSELPKEVIITTKEAKRFKLTILLADKSGCRLKYYLLEPPAVQVEGEEIWGEAVDGLQCGLRPEKLKWMEGEIPRLFLDLQNLSRKAIDITGLNFLQYEIEIDGAWYGWADMKMYGPDWLLDPGEKLESATEITLTASWVLLQDAEKLALGVPESWGKRLRLTSGKHTIRIRYKSQGRGLPAVSNPVEIEILPTM